MLYYEDDKLMQTVEAQADKVQLSTYIINLWSSDTEPNNESWSRCHDTSYNTQTTHMHQHRQHYSQQ